MGGMPWKCKERKALLKGKTMIVLKKVISA